MLPSVTGPCGPNGSRPACHASAARRSTMWLTSNCPHRDNPAVSQTASGTMASSCRALLSSSTHPFPHDSR